MLHRSVLRRLQLPNRLRQAATWSYSTAVGELASNADAHPGPGPSSSGSSAWAEIESAFHPGSHTSAIPRALPEPGVYKIQIMLKAFEQRFLKEASCTIRDLMLIHFSPKSRAVLDVSKSKSHELKHVNLHFPGGDYALQKDRSLFTVIRSPHIDKHSREQFERLVHKRLISFSTNNYSELTWFLDSLKLYEFTAVEINVKLTSNSYLLPTSTREQAKAQQPLLSSHMQRFKDYFPTTITSSSSSPADTFSEALSSTRSVLQAAAQEQRRTLQNSQVFQQWLQKLGPSHSSPPTTASEGLDLASQVSQQLDQQLLGTSLVAAEGQVQHKLLAAIHTALKGLAQKLALRWVHIARAAGDMGSRC